MGQHEHLTLMKDYQRALIDSGNDRFHSIQDSYQECLNTIRRFVGY